MSAARPDVSEVANYEVTVQLKSEVLDPEGRAIQETLARVGFTAVKSVSVSKRYVLQVQSGTEPAADLVDTIARDYLANPVSETYQVRKL